jgi:hypothetical protein
MAPRRWLHPAVHKSELKEKFRQAAFSGALRQWLVLDEFGRNDFPRTT